MINIVDKDFRLERAISLLDAANDTDPNTVVVEGVPVAKELLYAQRMSAMLERFAPEAAETVRLAVHAQHVERWKIPRGDYPMTRAGYYQWRTTLYDFHADRTAALLREAGYDEATIASVAAMVRKADLADPGTQTMEDVAALVFVESYMADFATQHPEYSETKWIGIVAKTWRKMSPRARSFALSGIRLPEALAPLILKAVKA